MGAGIAPFPAKMLAAVGAAQHRKVEGCGGKSQQDHRAAEEEVIGQGEQHGAHQHGDDQAIEQAAARGILFMGASPPKNPAARGSRPHRFGW